MQVPELYRYGREGSWFGIRQFFVYMVDGVAQVCLTLILCLYKGSKAFLQSLVIFFIITYTYTSPSARSDGYDVYLYEFSTVSLFWHSFYRPTDSHPGYGTLGCLDSKHFHWYQCNGVDRLALLLCICWNRRSVGLYSTSS